MPHDLEPDGASGGRPGRRLTLYDILALGMAVLTVMMLGWQFLIFCDPHIAVNPFPPSSPTSEISLFTDASAATDTPTQPPFAFIAQGDPPVTFLPQHVYPAQGCDWQGIAGQVLGMNDEPLTGMQIHLWGSGIDAFVTSGTNPNYGVSGWEQRVDGLVNPNEYFVQLLSVDGHQLSDIVRVPFPNSCAGNLALVYFKQIGGL